MEKIRLLIIDENPAVRQALETRLRAFSQIELLAVARDFQEGTRMARELHPDVILLEPKVRYAYGQDPILHLDKLANGRTPHSHSPGIIVLTSYMDEAEREAAIQAGARRYLLKHIDSTQLVAEIEAVNQEANPDYQPQSTSPLSHRRQAVMKKQLVKDWMSANVITISTTTTLPEAHKLMIEHQIRRLPIMKDGRLVGMVTRGDIRGAEPSDATSLSIWEINYLLSRLKIEEIMTVQPIAIRDTATVGEVAELMLTHKVSGLPVLNEQGDLVGIITESDIFRMVVADWRENN